MSAERDIVTIDQHRVWIEEPYALVCQLEGDITESALKRMRDVLEFVGGGRTPVIIVQDLSRAGAFTAGARKGIMDDPRTRRVESVICIGASFQMRVFMSMITKALKLVNPRIPRVLFTKDEAEGRAVLAVEREQLNRRRQSSPDKSL